MTGLDDDRGAELDKLKKSILEEESRLASAIDECNATVKAAYEKLGGLIEGYSRARGEFDRFQPEIVDAMTEFVGESPDDWQEGEEGQGYLEWCNVRIDAAVFPLDFKQPRELTTPEPVPSAITSALPRESGEVVRTSIDSPKGSGSALPIDSKVSAPEELGAEKVARRYFELTVGTSNKFWEVSQAGRETTTRYGKIGSGSQSKTKTCDSPEKATAETAKIVATKVKEGYVEKKLPGPGVGPAIDPQIANPRSGKGRSEPLQRDRISFGSARTDAKCVSTILPRSITSAGTKLAISPCFRHAQGISTGLRSGAYPGKPSRRQPGV